MVTWFPQKHLSQKPVQTAKYCVWTRYLSCRHAWYTRACKTSSCSRSRRKLGKLDELVDIYAPKLCMFSSSWYLYVLKNGCSGDTSEWGVYMGEVCPILDYFTDSSGSEFEARLQNCEKLLLASLCLPPVCTQCIRWMWSSLNTTKLNSVALVRTRTIPTARPPPVGEVSANFCG